MRAPLGYPLNGPTRARPPRREWLLATPLQMLALDGDVDGDDERHRAVRTRRLRAPHNVSPGWLDRRLCFPGRFPQSPGAPVRNHFFVLPAALHSPISPSSHCRHNRANSCHPRCPHRAAVGTSLTSGGGLSISTPRLPRHSLIPHHQRHLEHVPVSMDTRRPMVIAPRTPARLRVGPNPTPPNSPGGGDPSRGLISRNK